jgi:hypothetical protein
MAGENATLSYLPPQQCTGGFLHVPLELFDLARCGGGEALDVLPVHRDNALASSGSTSRKAPSRRPCTMMSRTAV